MMVGCRVVGGREEAVEKDARVPAELYTSNHPDDGGILEDVHIAKIHCRVLGGWDHFNIGAVFPPCDKRSRETHGTPSRRHTEVCLGIHSVRDVHDEASEMRDTVNEKWWDGPSASFLCREHDIGNSFKSLHDDGLHTTIFGGVVDEVVGKEKIGIVMRESIGGACFSLALEVLDAALN